MSVTDRESGPVSGWADVRPDPRRADQHESGSAPNGQSDLRTAGLQESLGRVAMVAAAALGVPGAAVTFAGPRAPLGMNGARSTGGQLSPYEQWLCADVVGSGNSLIIADTRVDRRISSNPRPGPASLAAWAGVPVRDRDGRVAGVLWVADQVAHQWSASDVAVLETLAQVASSDVALRAALAHSTGRAALAQVLEESLMPPRLPDIPGLQVAARHAPGGTESKVIGDFCDVFPSARGAWGIVVGDVCGKGPAAARRTALARYTLRALARRQTQPSVLLADLNQELLDWPTEDPRFVTAIYAVTWPVRGGAIVRISSAGHPLALVRTADGQVQEFGRPGDLLGVLAQPELHNSQRMLRPGDSLILFSDGVTEARGNLHPGLYGDERLRSLVAQLDGLPADAMAEAILLATLTFSGGQFSDDTAALVLKVPSMQRPGSRS